MTIVVTPVMKIYRKELIFKTSNMKNNVGEKILKGLSVVASIAILTINLQTGIFIQTQQNSTDLISIIAENTAFGQTEACVNVLFYQGNYQTQIYQGDFCIDEDGNPCGLKETCYPWDLGGNCQEITCD